MYQGTYRSFPVQDDVHVLDVCRMSSGVLCVRGWLRGPRSGVGAVCGVAGTWEFVRRFRRYRLGRRAGRGIGCNVSTGRRRWRSWRRWDVSLRRGRPFGDESWQRRTAARLGLEHTFRSRGRPRLSRDEG